MKSILLTTTALVAFAGAAAADGHISVTWSGTATAGIAREGGSDATDGAAVATVESLLADYTGAAASADLVDANVAVAVDEILSLGGVVPAGPEATADEVAEAIANIREDLAFFEDLVEFQSPLLDAADVAEANAFIAAARATLGQLAGTNAVETGDFEEYAEINATVTGSVALDSGVTLSASMSVDAGRGYDFADDDGFDSSGAQSGSVGFDNVVVDAGAYGKLTINPNDIAHLVDDDDDGSADFKYENDFGVASVAFVMDIDEDSDAEAADQSWSLVDVADLTGDEIVVANVDAVVDTVGPVTAPVALVYMPAVAADVQWSAKVSAPVADIATVYAAFDEEGGYDIGGSATVAGVSLTAKVKSEALAVEQDKDPEFDISGSYTVSGLTVGAGWNSIEDGDQWRISGSYTMDAITVSASTDEGEDWEVTGSYALSDAASIVAGVNYTEDAYVGVSFSF